MTPNKQKLYNEATALLDQAINLLKSANVKHKNKVEVEPGNFIYAPAVRIDSHLEGELHCQDLASINGCLMTLAEAKQLRDWLNEVIPNE